MNGTSRLAGCARAAVEGLCRRAGRVERARISGNVFGHECLDAVHSDFASKGARVSSSYWSDTQLLGMLMSEGPQRTADRFIPRAAGKRLAFVGGSAPERMDVAVVLFSSPHTRSIESLAGILGDFRKEAALLQEFSVKSSSNLHGLRESGIKIILLDLPSEAKAGELGLDFDEVAATYESAISASTANIAQRNREAARFFKGKTRVRVTCKRGTDMSFNFGGYSFRFEDLDFRKDWMAQVPGGEAFVPPARGSGEGTVITGPLFGKLYRLSFGHGRILFLESLESGKWRKKSNLLVEKKQELAEFGIGTNLFARPYYTGPIFEKTLGTVHFGVGGNAFFGGPIKSRMHRDFLVKKPTVESDGEIFMKAGKWTSMIAGNRRLPRSERLAGQ